MRSLGGPNIWECRKNSFPRRCERSATSGERGNLILHVAQQNEMFLCVVYVLVDHTQVGADEDVCRPQNSDFFSKSKRPGHGTAGIPT